VAGITSLLFIISVVMLFGSGNYFLAAQRAGVYPPRRVLQQRAVAIGGAGGVMFLLAILVTWAL